MLEVRAFAGKDDEAAYLPPRARAVLARSEGRSATTQTLLRPRAVGLGPAGWLLLGGPRQQHAAAGVVTTGVFVGLARATP